MAKYHLTEVGPKLCRASKRSCPLGGDHYESKREAEEAYSKLHMPLKSRPSPKKVLSKLQAVGLECALAKDLPQRLSHQYDSKRGLPKPGEVRSVLADPSVPMPDKPKGCLWLSPLNEAGKSAWREWCEAEEYGHDDGASKTAVLRPDAVVLTLDERTWVKLPKLWDEHAEEYEVEEDEHGMPTLASVGFLVGHKSGEMPRVHWMKLHELGVDAVRVNGWSARGHFLGWDCDSVVLLEGSALQGWEDA